MKKLLKKPDFKPSDEMLTLLQQLGITLKIIEQNIPKVNSDFKLLQLLCFPTIKTACPKQLDTTITTIKQLIKDYGSQPVKKGLLSSGLNFELLQIQIDNYKFVDEQLESFEKDTEEKYSATFDIEEVYTLRFKSKQGNVMMHYSKQTYFRQIFKDLKLNGDNKIKLLGKEQNVSYNDELTLEDYGVVDKSTLYIV
ncbi:Hypothetical_protein [Hexamita inflata]|uniref:Hypothetical_protein n=1 Tax=Hexamita inflata TaxID=28002 RepID=A0ABP1GIR5_9EUKA